MDSLPLSKLADTLIASEIVKLGGVIKEMIRNGEKIYNYTIGDFDSKEFPIPAELQQAIVQAYADGFTTYPAADGEMALRKALVSYLKKYEEVEYVPEEILIAAGGRPLIYAVYRAIVDEGDKVIYPVPSWNNNHYVHFTQGKHVVIEAKAENKFLPTADQIAKHIEGATLLALCSPLNPTGTTFTKEELEKICDLVLAENDRRGQGEKKLYVMYDQIYWRLTFGETVHYNPVTLRPRMKEYTIFVDGISKVFAATGVRVGWSMGPKNVIAKMRGINSHIGSWAPMAEQHAVANFINDDAAVNSFLLTFKEAISERLTSIYNGFIELKNEGFNVDAIAPEAAIYLTVQLDLAGKKKTDGEVLATQDDVTAFILKEAGLGLVPFKIFGLENNVSWYRLSVGTCRLQDVPLMFEQLKKALQSLS